MKSRIIGFLAAGLLLAPPSGRADQRTYPVDQYGRPCLNIVQQRAEQRGAETVYLAEVANRCDQRYRVKAWMVAGDPPRPPGFYQDLYLDARETRTIQCSYRAGGNRNCRGFETLEGNN